MNSEFLCSFTTLKRLSFIVMLLLNSPVLADTTDADSIVIENRKLTASEFAAILRTGKPIRMSNDTITGDWILGDMVLSHTSSIKIENTVFENNLIFSKVTLGEHAQLDIDKCHFKMGGVFAQCTFLPWSILFITNCTFDGLLTFDKCEFQPLTEVFIDSCQLIGGLRITECKGEWLCRIMNSSISRGCVVTSSTWQNQFMNCDFLANGSVKGDFSSTSLWECSFKGTDFELTKLPIGQSMGSCKGIKNLSYKESPAGLTALRNWFRINGYRQKEREATFALKKTENNQESQPMKFIQWFLFDLTSAWGMAYLRPLLLVIILVFALSILYWLIARTQKGGDIQRHWTTHRNGKVLNHSVSIRRLKSFARRKALLVPRLALLFSIMSAFNIGFREFNFGRWIRNITKNEYDLKASGWARTVSGIQALISVFLFALFLITYFGRPFD